MAAAPTVTIPEGIDGIVRLARLDGAPQNVLYGGLVTSKGRAYACTGANGLEIATAEPGKLAMEVFEGKGPSGKGCRQVARASDDTVLFTGQGEGGGAWVAALDATAHQAAGALPITAQAQVKDGVVEDLAATATHVFAAAGKLGVIVYRRDKAALTEVTRFTSGVADALGLALAGNTLYLANGRESVLRVDITEPAKPALVEDIATYGTARRLRVLGDRLYVATVNAGLEVHDLSKPKSPRLGSWATHASAVDLDVQAVVSADGKTTQTLVWVANWEDVSVIDATDPGKLVLVGSETFPNERGALEHVVNVQAGPVSPVPIAYVAEWSHVWSLAYVGGRTAPDVRINRSRVDFGIVAAGKKRGTQLLVYNFGTAPLTLSKPTLDNTAFSVNEDAGKFPLTIPAPAKGTKGTPEFVEVAVSATDLTPLKGTLTFTTNDPDEPTLALPLTANLLDGVQVGGPFQLDPDLYYQEYKTGNTTTVKQSFGGSVVLMSYFATW